MSYHQKKTISENHPKMRCDCKKTVSESHKKMSCDCHKNVSEGHTMWGHSTVIEDSGNSKNRIHFRSLSKSSTEASVKAESDQGQEQDIDF